jgi:hypothetical protein
LKGFQQRLLDFDGFFPATRKWLLCFLYIINLNVER